ncbi:MAG: hypothetical protein ACREAC_23535, partial [Blastocatellia bacterium]
MARSPGTRFEVRLTPMFNRGQFQHASRTQPPGNGFTIPFGEWHFLKIRRFHPAAARIQKMPVALLNLATCRIEKYRQPKISAHIAVPVQKRQ